MPDPSASSTWTRRSCAFVGASRGRRGNPRSSGDYDVDGATFVGALIRFFRALGIAITPYIPTGERRLGRTRPAAAALKEQGARLVITVDCGIVRYAPLKAARECRPDVSSSTTTRPRL